MFEFVALTCENVNGQNGHPFDLPRLTWAGIRGEPPRIVIRVGRNVRVDGSPAGVTTGGPRWPALFAGNTIGFTGAGTARGDGESQITLVSSPRGNARMAAC